MTGPFRKIWELLVLAILFLISTLACSASSAATGEPLPIDTAAPSLTSETIAVITIPADPTVTSTPEPTALSTMPPSGSDGDQEQSEPTSDLPTARVVVQSINLRTGPSALFPIYGVYPKDSHVAVLGKSTGEEWVEVQTSDGKRGWLSVQYIELSTSLADIPEVDVPDSWLITGKVIDSDGIPVEAINLAIYRPNNFSTRTDVYTNSQGEFYAYIPSDQVVTWMVDIVGLGCASHIMNENCELAGYVGPAPVVTVELPLAAPLEFVYEKATATISGKVFDANGQPAVDVRVMAERLDGMQVFGDSDEFGAFTLPAIDGTWVVYAVRFDPRREGDKISVTVSNVSVEGVTVVAP